VVGILLILGLFTGIAAFIGAAMNFSYVFAGSAGMNPLFIIISLFLIMAWRVAGWYGLDRIVLPWLGTPWQSGTLLRETAGPRASPIGLTPSPGRALVVSSECPAAPFAPGRLWRRRSW
jgi:thiosulfate dehydrogenase [quinone] large subunit